MEIDKHGIGKTIGAAAILLFLVSERNKPSKFEKTEMRRSARQVLNDLNEIKDKEAIRQAELRQAISDIIVAGREDWQTNVDGVLSSHTSLICVPMLHAQLNLMKLFGGVPAFLDVLPNVREMLEKNPNSLQDFDAYVGVEPGTLFPDGIEIKVESSV